LKSIPEGLSKLTELSGLFLNDNLLEFLPADIGNMALEGMYIYNNRLTELPDSFDKLSSLKYIRFDNTLITEFPPQLLGLTNLEYINFIDTGISVIPHEILGLEGLEQLAFREARLDLRDPRNKDYDELMKTLYDRGVKLYIIDYE